MPVLGIDEWQICLKDPAFDPEWNHPILLRKIGGSRWIVADADGVVRQLDIGGFEFLPIVRGAVEFPAHVVREGCKAYSMDLGTTQALENVAVPRTSSSAELSRRRSDRD